MYVRRIVAIGLAIFSMLIVLGAFGGYLMYCSFVRADGLEAAQEWARMAPLPETASDIRVETRGGPFTREFTIRFTAPSADLRSWIEKSPGTSNLKPVVSGQIRVYTIEPGAGATHAEVKVDDNVNSVVIHTYWS